MKIIQILILFFFYAATATLLESAFSTPTAKATADFPQKSLRNNIFSSVQKNPVSSSKSSVAPIIHLTPPDLPLDEASSVVSAKKHDAFSAKKSKSSQIQDVDLTHDVINYDTAKKNELTSHLLPEVKHDEHEKVVIEEAVLETIQKKSKAIEDKEEHKEKGVLYQTKSFVGDDQATVAFNFEEANLSNLISYIENVHKVKFIADDIIMPNTDAKSVAGHKITFRTNKNLTKKESWDLFLTFLHIAGLDVVPLVHEGFYRIVPLTKANSEAIPTYIGVNVDILPDSDMIVRYVYFAKNINPAQVQKILTQMQSGSTKLDVFSDLKALIFTDRACSIKSLMKVVSALDQGVLPEVLSVIKLKRANVEDVIALYKSLTTSSATSQTPKPFSLGKRESSLEYFPQDVGMFGDKRTNSLILLGVAKDVKKIEDFITKHVDVAIDRKAPPIFTYRLQYINATDAQTLLSQIVQYRSSTTAGQYGGIHEGMKLFQKMTIVADTHSNSLVINATEEDFEILKPLIEELDVPQKQVGLEVLIVQVKDIDSKTFGAQISGPNGFDAVATNAGKFGPTFLQQVTAQTSGIPTGTPIVATAGTPGVNEDFSIKSSLASLLGNPALNEVGSILVTFGQPIWAIFKILKTITSTHIIANPFVVVSNNCTAQILSGEERRLVSGEVISASALRATGFTPVDATLQVTITPQINKGNIINLGINVQNNQFTQSLQTDTTSGVAGFSPQDKKIVSTTASVANGETLVLGGIMTESYASAAGGVPFLENIPVLGWFFKSKTRKITRDHFLIFIAPRLLDPVRDNKELDDYTQYKLNEAQKNINLIDEADWFTVKKDPIQRAFFNTGEARVLQELRSSKTFAKREAIDGKVENLPIKQKNKKDKPVQSKKQAKQKKEKKKSKKQQQQESIVLEDVSINTYKSGAALKNSIIDSVQHSKGT